MRSIQPLCKSCQLDIIVDGDQKQEFAGQPLSQPYKSVIFLIYLFILLVLILYFERGLIENRI